MLSKTVVLKKKVWELLLECVVGSLIFGVCLYLILSRYLDTLIEVLNAVKNTENDFTALGAVEIFVPIYLIITVSITMGRVVMLLDEQKENKPKRKKKK